jgi:DNA-binding NarL/FixJ family response regulator
MMPARNARILIIEDEKGIVLAIDSWFRHHSKTLSGIILDHAPDLASGMERAKEAHLIILDLTLPDSQDPMGTLQRIPELRRCAPVVVLTGREDSDYPPDRNTTIAGISEYGAEAVLFKSMMQSSEGMDWLILCMQSALLRRAYVLKHKGEAITS